MQEAGLLFGVCRVFGKLAEVSAEDDIEPVKIGIPVSAVETKCRTVSQSEALLKMVS